MDHDWFCCDQQCVAKSKSGSEVYAPPVPGRNGAQSEALKGKTVVLTRVFPEIGGGMGLNLGKERLKAIVTAFGGRVTSSVSSKTDILIVGCQPGCVLLCFLLFLELFFASFLRLIQCDTVDLQVFEVSRAESSEAYLCLKTGRGRRPVQRW